MTREGLFPFFKVIVLGNSMVGKSSLVRRFLSDTFCPNILSTYGVLCESNCVDVDGVTYRLEVHDTPGQQEFREIVRSFYRGADGVILLYAVDDRDTFASLPDWMRTLENATQPDLPVVVVGNKINRKAVVRFEVAQEFALEKGCLLAMTSCKTGEGVQELFTVICQEMLKTYQRWGRQLNYPGGAGKLFGASRVQPEKHKKTFKFCTVGD
jgi:small GTP-binding protein